MNILFSYVLLLLGFFYVTGSVVEFTDEDFESSLAQHEHALVMFYAPWCGHCKKLKPEFDKAGSVLKTNDPPILLAKVDCTDSGKETCTKYDVSGYPTLKIFSYGEFLKEYGGPREATGIIKYMQSQVGPSSKELTSLEELESFVSQNEVTVVGFFPEETDLKGVFLQVASKLREKTKFAHTSASSIFEKYDTKEAIRLFRPKVLSNKFEDSIATYTDIPKVSEIESFITDNYHGLVGIRTRENIEDFKPPIVIAYYNVDYVKNPKGTNYWRNRVLKVAKSYTGKYGFAISGKDDFQHELNEYGLDYVPGDKPIILARGPNNEKYIMKDEFSIEALEKFLKDLDEGKMAPYLKSEEIPSDNVGPVKVAVAKNFDDVVINNGKDTLIEFYAPWCGHCKKLSPIYDELAEKMKDEEVAIVKMDATANDVPSPFDVRGFPSLYWLPKDNKQKPIPYEGGRDLKDFIKYIAEHATKELKNYNRKGKPKTKEEL